jgi:hypothetical protein
MPPPDLLRRLHIMLNENFIYKLARPVLGARKELSRSDFNTIYSVVQKK